MITVLAHFSQSHQYAGAGDAGAGDAGAGDAGDAGAGEV